MLGQKCTASTEPILWSSNYWIEVNDDDNDDDTDDNDDDNNDDDDNNGYEDDHEDHVVGRHDNDENSIIK